MRKKRFKNYKKEFKKEVLKMVQEGKKISELSRELNIPGSTISTWLKKEEKDNTINEEKINTRKLLKQLRDITEERDILKKAVAIFSKSPERNIDL